MKKNFGEYSHKITFLKNLQIILAVVCVVAIGIYIYFITRPIITAYSIEDECGPIGGTVSHPIDDEDTCSNACNAYCLSLKKSYDHSSFAYNLEKGCNNCDCFCKGEQTQQ